jgi:hypothetical protein
MSKFWPLILVVVLSLAAVLPVAAGAGPTAPVAAGPLQTPTPTPGCTPQTWNPIANAPTAIVRAWGSFFPPDGMFYSIGGRQSDAAGSDILTAYKYDPATNTWTTGVGTLPDNQNNNMVGGVLNGPSGWRIYVVGGSAAGATTASNKVAAYDPATDTFTAEAADPWIGDPAGDTLPGGSAVYNNKLYVFGGFQINIGMVSGIWEFDPNATAGTKWTLKTATLPIAKGYVPAATIGAYIYLAGGSSWDGTTLQDSTELYRYDPVADTITTLAALPRATGETRAVASLDGKVWVLGGGRVAPNPSSEVDIYDPVSDTWSTGVAFVQARRNFPADIDPASGAIVIAGGYATTTATNAAEMFTLTCAPTSVRVSGVTASSNGDSGMLWLLAAALFVIGAGAILVRRQVRA